MDVDFLIHHMLELKRHLHDSLIRTADLERRLDTMFRHGKVTDVDAEKQLYRQEVAQRDGQATKSPWIPYGQFAGTYKHHTPPVVGQQYTVFSPNGTWEMAVSFPFTWSNQFKSPSNKPDEHVTTYGDKYRLVERQDSRSFTLDKTKEVFSTDTITRTVNGGNTPKDSNGPNADQGDNDQVASGSSVTQEEKKITSKTPGVTIVHDEKSYSMTAAEELNFTATNRITLTVGGSNIVIEPAKATITSPEIATDGLTRLGSPNAGIQVELVTGPASKVFGV